MALRDEISIRKQWEAECIKAAEAYVKRKSYREAANAYSGAAHHRAIRLALQAEGRE